MITFHPEYDLSTRTWFVPGQEYEAPSLALLQVQLGPQVVIRDYYPLARPIAAAVLERLMPPTLRPIVSTVLREIKPPKIVKPKIPAPQRGRQRTDGRTKVSLDRDLLRQLWRDEVDICEIAERLGTSPGCVRVTAGAMRRAGIPMERRRSNHDKGKVRGDHHVE